MVPNRKSRGYWIAILALGLILHSGLGQAQEQPEKAQRDAQQEQRPAQPLPLPFPVEVVEDEAEAEARQRHEAEAREHEIADLVAQEGMNAATQAMNEATQRMADYAWWSTVFVAIGTCLVFASLVLMYSANRAAVAAVRVTRQIGEAQVRAYLAIEPVPVPIQPGEAVSAKVAVVNSGQSPAYRVDILTCLIVTDNKGEILEAELADAIDSMDPARLHIIPASGRNHAYPETDDLLAEADYAHIVVGSEDRTILLSCLVHYVDAFKRKRFTRYTGYVAPTGESVRDEDTGYYIRLFGFAPAPFGNDAD